MHRKNQFPGKYSRPASSPSTAALCRDFLPEEGVPGNDHEVILNHRLWMERYHGDRNILGKQIRIDDQPYTVVGVLQAGPSDNPNRTFTIPFAPTQGRHDPHRGNIFGRLKPGVTIAQAQAELSLIDRSLASAEKHSRGSAGSEQYNGLNSWRDDASPSSALDLPRTWVVVLMNAIYAQQSHWASSDDKTAKFMIDMERKWAEGVCTNSGVISELLADDFQGTTRGERYSKADELRDEKGPHSAHGCALDDAKVRFFSSSSGRRGNHLRQRTRHRQRQNASRHEAVPGLDRYLVEARW